VVVDGHSGQVLYGKAPGSTFYRAAVLVGGMAAGAFMAVDAAAFVFYLASQMEGSSAIAFAAAGLGVIASGFTLMHKAYRAFRYGEQYEYRGYQKKKRRIQRKREGNVLRAREVEQ
jgi:hypothetical protein